MSVKMNLRLITINHAADQEIEFLTKAISKLDCFQHRSSIVSLTCLEKISYEISP